MAKSTTIIVNVTTVQTNGAAAATTARAVAQGGPILDYPGNLALVKLKLQEAKKLLALVISVTDSGDTATLALLNGVVACLAGTSSPSTALITDLSTAYSSGPNAASAAKAVLQSGPIQDWLGNVNGARLMLKECYVLLGQLISVTDSGDSANLSLLHNCQNALV